MTLVPKFYKKKPVEIEAMQFLPNNASKVEEWCGGNLRGILNPEQEWTLEIYTLEGTMRSNIGDYIIKGIQGEFYSCKKDIFEETYYEVT